MKQSHRTLMLISVGTLLEWAEYVLYGYMALIFSEHFFGPNDPTLNLIKTYALFAAGYLMRPLGAIVFGGIGDRVGRRSALMMSMMLMGTATLCIGLLPTYTQIGITSTYLLLFLRLLQGFSVGGEYNGAGIYILEQNPKRPCFYGSFISASAAFGMVLGGVAVFIISQPGMPNWAFRIPFLFGALGCFVSLWLRKSVPESNAFKASQKKARSISWLQLIQQYPLSIVKVIAIAAVIGVYVYIGNVYFVVFLKTQMGFTQAESTLYALSAQTLVTLLIPVVGWYADSKPLFSFFRKGLLYTALATPFIYFLASTDTAFGYASSMALYVSANIWLSGPLMNVLQEQFPTEVRYRGIALSWGIGVALFGGTALMAAQLLNDHFQVSWACGIYVSVCALIAWWILSPPTAAKASFKLRKQTAPI